MNQPSQSDPPGPNALPDDEIVASEPAKPDPVLTDLAVKELQARGATDVQRGTLVTASTDLGNVSQRYPTVALDFPVSTHDVPGHSIKMTEASVSHYAHDAATKTAGALAAVAVRTAAARGSLGALVP